MEMYFSTHFEGVYVLFKGWKITSETGLVLSVVIVFVFSVIFEILKAYVCSRYSNPESCDQEENQALISDSTTSGDYHPRFNLQENLIKTFYFIVNIAYGYILMLIAMTFNVWLFLALITGYGFGYWFAQPHFQQIPVKIRHQVRPYGTFSDT